MERGELINQDTEANLKCIPPLYDLLAPLKGNDRLRVIGAGLWLLGQSNWRLNDGALRISPYAENESPEAVEENS